MRPYDAPHLSASEWIELLASQRRTRIYRHATECVYGLVVVGLVFLGLWA